MVCIHVEMYTEGVLEGLTCTPALQESESKATLKKKFVSCTAGGRNYGQSGGCKIFLFFSFLVRK